MDGIATLRIRTEQRKSGKEWRIDYFICSNKNSNRANCKNKQIRADYIEDEIKNQLEIEIKKIKYSKQELKEIFKDSRIDMRREVEELEKKLKKSKIELEFINKMLEEIYQDKVNKIIGLEDFKCFYSKKNIEKMNTVNMINDLECEINKRREKIEKVDIDEILNETKIILSLKNITKEIYEKLIDQIEFDSEKNLHIKFKFKKVIE